MKVLVALLAVAITIAVLGLLLEGTAFGGALMLHQRGLYDDEIGWLESFMPAMRWERGIERLIVRRHAERVGRALQADRLDRAVLLFREARRSTRQFGRTMDEQLMEMGVETFSHAADRMAKHGRLSEAADWEDSLFVLAIRSPAPHQRYMALAGFTEGLDLRVRDGKPCSALAHVRWAKQGLGGTIPGMADNVEEDLAVQCAQSQRASMP